MISENRLKDLDELIAEHAQDAGRLICFPQAGETPANEPYPHWERLSQLSPPQYLTLRDWWMGLKIRRRMGRQEIGFADREGRPFTMGSIEFFAAEAHDLDWNRTDGLEVLGLAGSKHDLSHLAVWARREEAIASSQLDGAVLELEAARELLRRGRKPRDRGERMVANIFHALEDMRKIGAVPLNLAGLRDLHQRLTAGTLARAEVSGRLRQAGETVASTAAENGPQREPPAAEELPVRVAALLALANGRAPARFLHPLLRAAALHFWVLHDQPFAEGNGRLARVLFFWSVRRAGYAIFDYLAPSAALRDAPAAYARALAEIESDENDVTYLAAHLLAAVAKARRRSREQARRYAEEIRAVENIPGLAADLNERQRLVLARALQDPKVRYTLQEHARDHDLARQTARHDFAPLVRRGLFEETKIGKALAFFPTADLAAKLRVASP